MKLRSSGGEFARLLSASDGKFDLYELHRQYRLGGAEILRLVALFERLGIITQRDDGFVELLPGGREKIWAFRKELLLRPERPWAEPQLESSRLCPSEPYLPDLAKIDRQFFLNKIEADQEGG